jgi:hypothetical protein
MTIKSERAFRDRGLTLLEVIIACFIFLVVTIAIVHTLISVRYLGAKDRITTSASFSAQMVLENILRDVKDSSSFSTLASSGYREIDQVNRLIYDVNVTDVKTDLKKVTVHIFYEARGSCTPDTSRLRGGKILQYSCYVIKP